MVTHKDIAREVGVSQATVSKVLSNKSNKISLSQKTRMAVIEAAKKLGYNRNKVASGLIQLVEQSIAILMEHVSNPFNSVIMRGIERELVGTDYQFMFTSSNGIAEQSLGAIESLTRRYTTGFILMPFFESNTSQAVHTYLKNRGIPFVQTNFYSLPNTNDAPLVCTNNHEIFKKLTSHLISLGHERIALVYTAPNYSCMNDRIKGYEEALQEAGIPVRKSLKIHIPREKYLDVDIKRSLIDRWLKAKNKPTAVMTFKDDAAIQFIHLFKQHGLKVPDDMAVTGFDDYRHYIPNLIPETQLQLTTVRQNLPEIGRQAVHRLYAEIEAKGSKVPGPLEVIVPAKIIIRGSCGAPIPKESTYRPGTIEIDKTYLMF